MKAKAVSKAGKKKPAAKKKVKPAGNGIKKLSKKIGDKVFGKSKTKKSPKKKEKPNEITKVLSKFKKFDEDVLIEKIMAGETYRAIAVYFEMTLTQLFVEINGTKESENKKRSARVREALNYSADAFTDMAEEVLKKKTGKKYDYDVARARELAQHYRWKASKRSPKRFGDKVDITTDGEKVNGNVHIFIPDNGRD